MNSKQVGWYTPGAPKVPENMKILLRDWSKVGPTDQDIEKHIEKTRDAAWNIHPYPCIGGYRFLGLGLAAHPSFNSVVSTLSTKAKSSSPIFLDLGCCVGQDIRSLVKARVPGSHIVGVDLESAFVEIGYDLFQDREKLGVQFLFGDILTIEELSQSSSHPLQSLIGRINILWNSAFLHLWDRPGQIKACRKMLLLMRNEKGVKILGRHAGSTTPGLVKHVTNPSGVMYKHDPESFQKMWKEEILVQEEQGVEGHEFSRSTNADRWVVRAWFEEDSFLTTKNPQDAGQKPDRDWFTKVVGESSRLADGTVKKEGQPDSDVRILVWEAERVY